MSNDRMILVLCLIISIIALIIGSVALSRDDRQHTIIEYDDSSTNSTSEKSLYSVALAEKRFWFTYSARKRKLAHHIIPEPSAELSQQKYIPISNDYQIHSFNASQYSPNFYIILDGASKGMPSRFPNRSNTVVVSELHLKNFHHGTIKGIETKFKAQKDIDRHGLHYYDWTLSADPRNTSVEIIYIGGSWVCFWDLKQ